MSDRTADYDFDLPDELIARYPVEKRDHSRMFVIRKNAGTFEHRHFYELPSLLEPGDLAVLNNARVIPARLFSNDGKIELLVLSQESPTRWVCMVRPGRKMRVGAGCEVGGSHVKVLEVLESGERVVELDQEVNLDEVGALPLPPYFGREEEPDDRIRYQTVYAKVPGAIAAPTAGLHFTPEILRQLDHAFVTLHVGAGTFAPVKSETLAGHKMHSELYAIDAETAARINAARRVVAVGTTVVRVLESCLRDDARRIVPQNGSTDIFIHPPKKVAHSDVLLTNFHLPKSTLLMLVSAFAGKDLILSAYAEAVRQQYRFYSYGDCMLILP